MNKKRDLITIAVIYIIALSAGLAGFVFIIRFLNQVLYATFFADVICTVIIFIFSVMFNNSSMYDPYWSVIPPFIFSLWLVVLKPDSSGVVFMGIAILVWSVRLSYNWAVNWRGLKQEDWRYREFRESTGKWYWPVSFFGIHFFPTVMVFLGLLPLYNALNSPDQFSPFLMLLGFLISAGAVMIAYLADKELRKHRNSCKALYSIKSGIWKYSRHPNYLGEISFWFGLYIMVISLSNAYFTVIGFLAMVGLFEGYSIPKMEKRLLHSKSDYRMIQMTVPRLLPLFFKKKPLKEEILEQEV